MYQSQERIHRIGQEHTCNYIYLLAENTTDKNIYKTITKKQKLNDMVYGLIEEYTKEKE
jgi:SNF2 family DNA or RNA helicase